MKETFYATAATVIPVFLLAHAVLRRVAAELLMFPRKNGGYLLDGWILHAAIAACVLIPLVGEIAALMALTGYPGPYAMGLTWLALSWTAATFAAISIRDLLNICGVRKKRDDQKARQAAINPAYAGEPSTSAPQTSPIKGL